MKEFIDSVIPKYSSVVSRGSVDVIEHESGASVKKVVWTGADFQYWDHQMAKDMTSFFNIANSPEVFRKDCDGVMLFEKDGKKYMFLTELKSKFDTEKLHHAKTQIVSSFLKTNMLLHLSNKYKLEDYTIKGFIVGYPPKSDFVFNMDKGSMLSGGSSRAREFGLTIKLFIKNDTHTILLRPSDVYCLKSLPLGSRGIFPEIELHFIPVPSGSSDITLKVEDYL